MAALDLSHDLSNPNYVITNLLEDVLKHLTNDGSLTREFVVESASRWVVNEKESKAKKFLEKLANADLEQWKKAAAQTQTQARKWFHDPQHRQVLLNGRVCTITATIATNNTTIAITTITIIRGHRRYHQNNATSSTTIAILINTRIV